MSAGGPGTCPGGCFVVFDPVTLRRHCCRCQPAAAAPDGPGGPGSLPITELVATGAPLIPATTTTGAEAEGARRG
ncbi:hypothetical protein [Pseudonocardia sp. KRD291]|uniref:hypothetical protein n=1 Tax=Pseudonocardia sp. KRD291 TaxID=2792007 RepID=UPI001C4A260D|nr:hypothetical protein [Pseudonocardia sp. KRD291]MBW0101532.1 hypothetical protein [Pseudonocardia sp. KRD291]